MPPNQATADVAVLICPAFGYDALPAHCSLRLLADQLAESGYPALRYDYPGTGDACDEEIDRAGSHWLAWRQSVDHALNWLRATTGATRFVLCGMRGSALLAAPAAAEREDIVGLVLLMPVMRGRSYLRQLQVEAKIQSEDETPLPDGLVFREFRFNAATVVQISGIDLRQVRLKAGQQVAIAAPGASRPIAECVGAWKAEDVAVRELAWEGFEPLVRQNIIEEDSLADFSQLVAWLHAAVPPVPATASSAISVAPVNLEPDGCIETPLNFGPGRRLFGMLCRPANRSASTVVLIGNGGRDPHYGAARHAVTLARRLAHAGIASLRMDFAGLGDSLGPSGEERLLSKMFTADRSADVRAALDMLECRGFRRFAMAGLCAGAYHAFRAARVDTRLSVLLLINMPFFSLPRGSAVDHLYWREMVPVHFLHRLPRLQSWKKLFALRQQLGAIFRSQIVRLRGQAADQVKSAAIWFGFARQPTFAQRSLAELCARGVRVLFLFSRSDHAIAAIEREMGAPGDHLERHYPGTGWRIFAKMDHDLSYVVGREVAELSMIEFVSANDTARSSSLSSCANEAAA